MKRSTGYRLAEFSLLLGIARFATWLTVGNWPTANQFFTRPLDTLLDGYFIMSSFHRRPLVGPCLRHDQ